jgi:cyclopropane fatty-acyl-phospholipid synthase-like methyltransferase/methyltransferase-like protein
MSTGAGSSYDEIPYKGSALFLTYPDHLAALARLFGVSTPEVETCRVLELGCARGDNLIPMAVSLPEARFVGIDLSPRQIAEGRATIAELGLENIELRAQSIMDIGPELGQFGFILAHGVYSWVAEPVRQKILELCSRFLEPNGLAYVSYNIKPGWHMRIMARDMMTFRARGISEIRERVEVGRNFMRGMAHLLAKHDNAYARCLREEAEKIVGHDETYVAHEYFDEANEPIYFYQFVECAAAHGLRHLTEAKYWTMAANQSPELFKRFGDSALTWLEREQIYDFIRGGAFRSSVLCRDGVPCSRTPTARSLMSLRIASLVRSVGASSAPGSDGGEEFHNLRGDFALRTNDPVICTALRILNEARPRSVPFETLWSRVDEHVASIPPALEERPPASPAGLAGALLDLFSHNIIELHVREPEFTTEISEFPRASAIARRQAKAGLVVANLRHRLISLVDFDQIVLTNLDGRHDRRALLDRMHSAMKDGGYAVEYQGRPLSEHPEAESVLKHLLEASLQRLAAGAVLVG